MLSKETLLGQKILYFEIPIFRECPLLHSQDKKSYTSFYPLHSISAYDVRETILNIYRKKQ